MRRRWLFLIPILFPLFIFLFGEAVLQLWNWLMPAIFGLHTITFWQALGLLALSWLLFGGMRGMHSSGIARERIRRRMWERWERMTPEERERFRQGMRGRCGVAPPPEAEPKS